MEKYFKYDDEYISGWTYFGRSILATLLSIILIGLYISSVTAYKRAKSLGHKDSAALWGVWGFLVVPLSFTPLFIITNTIPHWYLWFSNGKKGETNKESIDKKIVDVSEDSLTAQQLEKMKKIDEHFASSERKKINEGIMKENKKESVIPKKYDKKNNVSEEVLTLEISKDEMDKLEEEMKDEEDENPKPAKAKTFNNNENKPFSGILISKKTDEKGRIECEYLNGNRHGKYIQYDEEDENKISHTKYYKNGLLHGPYTWWDEKYKDGKKPKKDKEIPKFNNDYLDAMGESIFKKHDVMLEINYKDGLKDGKWIQFNFNGGTEYETNYKDGKKDGVWRGYFNPGIFGGQGRLKQVSVYKENKHISSKYYDFDGEEISKEEAIDDEEWGGEIW